MALLAAAKSEPVSEEEIVAARADRQGEPTPVRDVLMDLAADWRIKAQQARTAGTDATPFPASHKLYGQADLLDQCAEQIEAVAAGRKEGR